MEIRPNAAETASSPVAQMHDGGDNLFLSSGAQGTIKHASGGTLLWLTGSSGHPSGQCQASWLVATTRGCTGHTLCCWLSLARSNDQRRRQRHHVAHSEDQRDWAWTAPREVMHHASRRVQHGVYGQSRLQIKLEKINQIWQGIWHD